MKLAALLMASSLFSALDPNGCGGALGSNTANAPDGGSSGGTDDTADSGALATQSCGALGNHFFCETFDNGGELPGAFDLQSTSTGSLALDADAKSAPNALLSTTFGSQNVTRTYARLEKAFKETAKRFTLSYSEFLDAGCVGPSDGVETGALGFASDNYFLGIRHGSPDHVVETSLAGGVYVQGHNLKTGMPRGAWTRVTLDVDLERRTMDLTVDGQKIIDNEPLKYAPSGTRAPKIWVGLLTDNITAKPAACKLRIDDVALDIER